MNLRLLVLTAVVVIVVVGWFLATDGGDGDGDQLPAIAGDAAPLSYRMVYEVDADGTASTEEHVVHRPFDAYIAQRDDAGQLVSEQWSTLGALVTRSKGAPAVRVDTPIAPAADDLRPDLFDARLTEAGRLVPEGASEIGGRPCRRSSEAGVTPDAVVTTRCIDELGLVLEERWTQQGEVVRVLRAVELQLGEDVPDIDVPDAEPLGAEMGNGAVTTLGTDEHPPFAEAFELPAPDGFTFVGRYAVVPPRLGPASTDLHAPRVALYTDVWRRGADLLLLDQGATTSGPPPFDERSPSEEVELARLGTAELALDLRIAEVRLTRPDGGFVRLAGTVAPDELLRLAGSLDLLEVAR